MISENETDLPESDVIWGATAIGQALGLDPRKTFYLLESGNLPAARKIGRIEPKYAELPYGDFKHHNPKIVAYIISKNIRRRHLTKQEQADLIVAAMSATTDLAKSARSVKRSDDGHVAGSTKDPIKA